MKEIVIDIFTVFGSVLALAVLVAFTIMIWNRIFG